MPYIYLVVEPEQIIAQDLAHAIRSFDPAADVRVVSEPGAGLSLLPHVRAVFLHDEPTRSPADEAMQQLQDAEVPLIFLGSMAENRQQAGAVLLFSPFSEATVAAALRQVLEQT